ncbi:ras-related and estrogen-regulated growth inhibitor-like [Limulus polyphemus]|uniref:small monomeric GTPase n=1 Tax=Limulus polyphemus TaxID=6850 RepID=A0ABM1THH2_LIMPO|nr:ras-related and estrogen-regulated growth inhibitor-like [Limulus polyphemus]
MTTKGGRLAIRKFGLANLWSKDSQCNFAVLGAEEVGKTALVVRFLTKKFLSEYSHCTSFCYERNVSVNDKILPVRITDTSGKDSYTSLKSKGLLEGADGYLIVYSVTDKRSFVKARELLKLLKEDFGEEGQTPVALIGNKDDLVHYRAVCSAEGQRVALFYPGCLFYECSAAREAQNVETAFQKFLGQVVTSKEQRRRLSAFSVLTPKIQNPRRNSAGNSTLSSWWKKNRPNSEREVRQDRTLTM